MLQTHGWVVGSAFASITKSLGGGLKVGGPVNEEDFGDKVTGDVEGADVLHGIEECACVFGIDGGEQGKLVDEAGEHFLEGEAADFEACDVGGEGDGWVNGGGSGEWRLDDVVDRGLWDFA